ncbi:MAG: hypothetical protein AVDCRST_MAG73-2312 [uncultured Thermomicrobiales bacterium]|uniref:Uncharacterized protein n=1 Tax=uncultured Thermomicrobiales bacterium TaxID=1645740 RepID=A0A6J4UAR9_9BACT|nr:MAG: hypothetical protein AVDCRST_MAG73-2312 [uncultured Thermomicrobiales bacterium]
MTDQTPDAAADESPGQSAAADVREHGCVAHGLVWLIAGTALVVLMAGVTLACFWLSRLGN